MVNSNREPPLVQVPFTPATVISGGVSASTFAEAVILQPLASIISNIYIFIVKGKVKDIMNKMK